MNIVKTTFKMAIGIICGLVAMAICHFATLIKENLTDWRLILYDIFIFLIVAAVVGSLITIKPQAE